MTTEPNQSGQSFFLRISPYFFTDGAVEGASLTLVNITEEVELRRDLTLQSEKLHLAMKAAKMGSWDTDLDNQMMDVDSIAAQIGGHEKAGRYDRKTFFENVVPEDAKALATVHDAALKSNESYSRTVRVKQRDGSIRWAQVHAQPYVTLTGARRKSGLWIDVTELITLQNDLQVKSDRLLLAMDAGTMGAWDMDLAKGVSTLDPTAAKIAGLDADGEMSIDDHLQHVMEEDKAELKATSQKAANEATGYSATLRIVKSDEPMRCVQVHAAPYQSDGVTSRFAGVVIDVTELLQLQGELEVESTRRSLAMRAGQMGLGELDVESGEMTIDPVMADQLALPAAGIIALSELTANFVEEDKPLVEEHLKRAIKSGEEYEYDFRIDAPGSEMRWMRTRGLPYTSADGRRKVVGPTLDVTAHKQQGVLLDEMSHRIKNLFAVISGLVQAVPKEQEESKRMAADLVERIVSLGKVYDLARKDISAQGLDLEELLSSVLEPHRSSQALSLNGPAVQVNPDLVNTLTLIVHELTTNTAKYGAFSDAEGALDVSWSVNEQGAVAISWKEKVPGFEVSEPHSGFGSFLIESGIRQLHGNFDRSFSPDGAVIEFSLRLSE